jgi:HAMP domain-containing protein
MRGKILYFIGAIVLVFVLMTLWSTNEARKSFRDEVSTNLEQDAVQTLRQIDKDIFGAIEDLSSIADIYEVSFLLGVNNRAYMVHKSSDGESATGDEKVHGELGDAVPKLIWSDDCAWRYAAAKTKEDKQDVKADEECDAPFSEFDDFESFRAHKDNKWVRDIYNPEDNWATRELQQRKDFLLRQYGYNLFDELYVTDRQGVVVAMTEGSYTSDLVQSDEDWWWDTVNFGLYVEDPKVDVSTGQLGMNMALTICEDGVPQTQCCGDKTNGGCQHDRVLGVVKALFVMDGLRGILETVSLGPQQRVILTDESGMFIAEAFPLFSGQGSSDDEKGSFELGPYKVLLTRNDADGPNGVREGDDSLALEAGEPSTRTPCRHPNWDRPVGKGSPEDGVSWATTACRESCLQLSAPGVVPGKTSGYFLAPSLEFETRTRETDPCGFQKRGEKPGKCRGCNTGRAPVPGEDIENARAGLSVLDDVLVGWAETTSHSLAGYQWEGLHWRLYRTERLEKAFEDVDRTYNLMMGVLGVVLLFAAVVSMYLSGVLVRPLLAVREYAYQVSRDQAAEPPSFAHSKDEVGDLARVIKDLVKRLQDAKDGVQDAERRLRQTVEAYSDNRLQDAALAKRVHMLRMFYEQLSSMDRGVMVLDEHGAALAVNERAASYLGLEPRAPWDLNPPAIDALLSRPELSSVLAAVQTVAAGQPSQVVSFEDRVGLTRRLELSGRRYPSDDGGSASVLFLDDLSQAAIWQRYEKLVSHFQDCGRCAEPCQDELDATPIYQELQRLIADAESAGEPDTFLARLHDISYGLDACSEARRVLERWKGGERGATLRVAREVLYEARQRWPLSVECTQMSRLEKDLRSAIQLELEKL